MADAMTCRICPTVIEARSKTGRPASYCSTACRRVAEFEIRRINVRLIRLEDEAEACRRDRSGMQYVGGDSKDERSASIAGEIERAQGRLRELLADER